MWHELRFPVCIWDKTTENFLILYLLGFWAVFCFRIQGNVSIRLYASGILLFYKQLYEIKYVVEWNYAPFKWSYLKCKITLGGDAMKIERDERKFDFHGIGLAIKKAREREGMTQEQLGYIVDRDPRTIMYHENDGQHPSLNAFYQMVTMFGISVDEYFYPDMSADEAAKKRINIQLNSLNESELRLVEGIINAIIENRETEEV